jgi:glycosyltransferase involved in cell wall biosynthesis
MRILFLSQVLPFPLDAGPKMRSYFTLRHLSQKHEVTLVTFLRSTDRIEDIVHLGKLCYAVHPVPMRRSRWRDLKFLGQSLLRRQPFLIIRDQVPAMTSRVRYLARAERFDAIHADQLWMAQYALAVRAVSTKPKLLLDQHNAVHLIPNRLAKSVANPIKRAFLGYEARLLAAYESEICHRFDHVVWVTEEDRRAVAALPEPKSRSHSGMASPLRGISGQPPSTVIPICVDPTQVIPVVRDTSKKRITFLGGLHWPPNVEGILWFAKHVFPQVRAEIPEAILTVIGKNPPAGLEGEGIEVTGYVSDPMPYLSETAAFIVPLQAGGGMRVKILDAWSWGLPVISTTIGAEGIETQPEQNILIADTPQAFGRAVVRVLREPGLAQQLAQGGRQTVIEKYDWRKIYSAWDEVYARIRQ